MPDYGFPKELRLTRAAEYKAVFSKAKYKVSCRFLLIFAIRNDLPQPRLGVVVGKKNVAKAVQRNRIKRVLRTSYRLNQDLLSGLDIVILARSNLDSLDNQKLAEQIQSLWRDLVKKHTADT
ncbi:MAG: ribonuclease P protein component [Gammaproteobacteria bacterium]|nr:ribonuclease P protein component [Gammaproteobacteria bacterium]